MHTISIYIVNCDDDDDDDDDDEKLLWWNCRLKWSAALLSTGIISRVSHFVFEIRNIVLTPARLDFRYLNEFRFSNNYEVALSTICSFDVDVGKSQYLFDYQLYFIQKWNLLTVYPNIQDSTEK